MHKQKLLEYLESLDLPNTKKDEASARFAQAYARHGFLGGPKAIAASRDEILFPEYKRKAKERWVNKTIDLNNKVKIKFSRQNLKSLFHLSLEAVMKKKESQIELQILSNKTEILEKNKVLKGYVKSIIKP